MKIRHNVLSALSNAGVARFYIPMMLDDKGTSSFFNATTKGDKLCLMLNAIYETKHFSAILAASEKATSLAPNPSVEDEPEFKQAERSITHLAAYLTERVSRIGDYAEKGNAILLQAAIAQIEAAQADQSSDIQHALAMIREIKEMASDIDLLHALYTRERRIESSCPILDTLRQLHESTPLEVKKINSGALDRLLLSALQPVLTQLLPDFARSTEVQQLRIVRQVALDNIETSFFCLHKNTKS